MRKALLIGIDFYEHFSSLSGCVNDAQSVKAALERNADGTINFGNPKVLTVSDNRDGLSRSEMKDAVRELFRDDSEIALFYFAGHGYIEDTGGYLCPSDARTGDDGLPLSEVMTFANQSPAQNKIIILDSCHGGIAGSRPDSVKVSEINSGITILTASTAEQYAYEVNGGGAGLFTNLMIDALEGAAANLVGHVTPGSLYAHIDQSLGPWAQRPVFKTNVKTFVSLRKATPPISLAALQSIAAHFPQPGYRFQLDPSYEPERTVEQMRDSTIPRPDPAKTAIFAVLQKLVKVNLVKPVGAPHMWHAAMQSKACELTVLGEHYRNLVAEGLI